MERGATYLMSVKSERSTFTVGFEAADDDAAIAHTIGWAAKAHITKGSTIQIVRPDGSLIDLHDSALTDARA